MHGDGSEIKYLRARGPTLMDINVEGLTKAKREVIQHLTQKHRAVGILLQETHSTKDEQLQIPGFNIIAAIHHPKHGTATYARSDVLSGVVTTSLSTDPLQWMAAFIEGVTTINVYKHPNIPFTQLPQYPHPVIYAGDFNCQHTLWGYRNDTTDGTMLNDWASNLDLTLLYDNRQPNSFCSDRLQMQTNHDLAFSTTHYAHTNCVHRIVTYLCPRSKHRPYITTHDALIKPTPSAPMLRWNFRKAHWDDFTKDTCKLLLELPDPNTPDIDDVYCLFISAIIKTPKQHIPRGHRTIYPRMEQRM